MQTGVDSEQMSCAHIILLRGFDLGSLRLQFSLT